MDKPAIITLSEKIKERALSLGFYSCGISKAEHLEEDEKRLQKWLDRDLHAGMNYMENHFEKRTNPTKILDGAKSVISVLYNYFPNQKLAKEDNYHISKYAYGTDYHYVIKDKLKNLINFINTETGGVNARAFVDSAPVLDRAWAVRAGLGWIGKNTNLITKKQGSFFFIGEIISDLVLDYSDTTIPNHCGACTRCIDACPTHALRPFEVNANRCISYLTIENKDENLPDDLKGKFMDWIFGCDICQDVCPWNRFSESHNEPGFEPSPELQEMRKPDWENLSEEQFRTIFKDSPVKRTRYKGLIRNIGFAQS